MICSSVSQLWTYISEQFTESDSNCNLRGSIGHVACTLTRWITSDEIAKAFLTVSNGDVSFNLNIITRNQLSPFGNRQTLPLCVQHESLISFPLAGSKVTQALLDVWMEKLGCKPEISWSGGWLLEPTRNKNQKLFSRKLILLSKVWGCWTASKLSLFIGCQF